MPGTIREAIIAGLEKTKPAKTGLEKLVFGNADEMTFDTEKVSVDTFDGTRGASKYTARGAKGQTVGLEGWDTSVIQPPLIDEKFNITAQDLKVRGFGESNINQPLGSKFQTIVNKQLRRFSSRNQTTYNKQIVELITSGKVTIVELDDKGNAKDSRVEDFKMPAEHIYTVGTAWNDTAADIFGDIRVITKLITKNSGLVANKAIIGETTLTDIMNNDKILKLIDNRRIKFGELEKSIGNDGLISWGNILGLEIYTFEDYDENGNEFIPTSSFIPFASDAETDIYYGSQDVMENGEPKIIEAKQVMTKISDEDAVAVAYRFKSAKLYGLTQSAGFANITTR